MVCVTTVLELTEANCVPSNQNITLRIEARGGVPPQRYARDLTVAAVICFIGENETQTMEKWLDVFSCAMMSLTSSTEKEN